MAPQVKGNAAESICPAKDMPEQVPTAHAQKQGGEGYGRLMAAYSGFMAGYGGFMEGRLFEEIWMTTFPTPGVAKRKLSDPTIKIQGLHSMDTTHLHVVGIPPLNHPSTAQTPNTPL